MPNTISLQVTTDHPVPVEPSLGGSVTVVNASGDTLYYADNPQVSASNNQGSLTAGQSTLFSAPAWLRSAGLSTVTLTVSAAALGTSRFASFGLSSDNFTTNSSQTDVLQDFPIVLPVSTARWRLRIGNPGHTGTFTLTPIVLGNPDTTAAGAYNYLTAPPVQALPAMSTNNDGSDVLTAWVTDPTLQFTADQMRILRFGFTCPGGTVITACNRPSQSRAGSGASADYNLTNPTHGNYGGNLYFLDIRLEYQYFGTQPTVLALGDSIQTGYQDALPSNITGPCVGWLAVAAMRERFTWIDCSAGGLKLSDFTSAASSQYARFDPAILAQASIIFINLGVNDAGSVAIATYIANLKTVIATAKALAAPNARVYVGTVIQQPNFKPGILTAGAAASVTTLTTSVPYANADAIDIGKGTANLETRTVSGASTGNGPYTTTVSVATTNAHGIYESVGLANESRRRDYNAYIRAGVAGVDAIFDFDRATAAYFNPYALAPEFIGTGTIHPSAGGHMAMAEAVRLIAP